MEEAKRTVWDLVPFKREDYIYLSALFVLMLFIWLRNLAWISTSDDTLPILIAIPLFVWLGIPWDFREVRAPFSKVQIAIAGVMFLIGIVGNLTLLLAAAWTLLLWVFVAAWMKRESHSSIKKLLILPLMAFPWIALDADQVGWWFRLSGAYTTAKLFSTVGFDVTQAGTLLFINGLPISVEVACAGLNNLQSMLISGSIVNFILLGETNRYWFNIPLLVLMAWLANTLRIIVIATAALAVSPSFALGSFHTFGGWFILVAMFGMCWLLLSLQEPKQPEEPT